MRPERTAPVNYIVWHCSATKATSDIGRLELDRMHRARGWDGIGYHAVIRLDGRIEWGEDLRRVGAHTTGHNYDSVGVCLIGGLDAMGGAATTFNAAQIASAIALAKVLSLAFPKAKHVGHRDLSPDLDGDKIIERHEWMKMCPCFEAEATFAKGALVVSIHDKPGTVTT